MPLTMKGKRSFTEPSSPSDRPEHQLVLVAHRARRTSKHPTLTTRLVSKRPVRTRSRHALRVQVRRRDRLAPTDADHEVARVRTERAGLARGEGELVGEQAAEVLGRDG